MAILRRQFKEIAHIIKQAKINAADTPSAKLAIDYIERSLADMCAYENNLFDRDRFHDACSIE